MANEEHLKILEQGVEVWNEWRDEHIFDYVIPEFGGAKLRSENLRDGDFFGANFDHADFSNADLSGADLSSSDLRNANLSYTNLYGADLAYADLSNANLDNANLSNVELSYANLTNADLSGVNLSNAFLLSTIFANVCLKDVSGLCKCNHEGPSIIDHRTIQRSGMLPVEFLRGCGLPDFIIDTYRDFIVQPYYSCFISYSTKDQEFVEKIYADLQNNGIRCWYDAKEMQGGKKLREQIKRAISQYDRHLLILSENSMNSELVKTEIADTRVREMEEGRQMLFPI